MRITKSQLRRIIREAIVKEAPFDAQSIMDQFIDKKWGARARVGTPEHAAAEREREERDRQASAAAREPLPPAELKTKLDQLESDMKRHDWYHELSDDHRVWSKGSSERAKINGLSDELKRRGHTDQVDALFKKYAPPAKELDPGVEVQR